MVVSSYSGLNESEHKSLPFVSFMFKKFLFGRKLKFQESRIAKLNSRDLTPRHASGSEITLNFGFISRVTDISEGSLPIIFSSMVKVRQGRHLERWQTSKSKIS